MTWFLNWFFNLHCISYNTEGELFSLFLFVWFVVVFLLLLFLFIYFFLNFGMKCLNIS